MDDILARIFLIFLLILYTGVALVFVGTWIRNLIWRPIKRKLWPQRQQEGYRRIKSTSREESSS